MPRNAPLKCTESQLTSLVINIFRLYEWKVHHSPPSLNARGQWVTALRGDRGLPDIIVAKFRILAGIELKVKPNKPTESQLEWLTASGGLLVFPDDIPEMEELAATRSRESALTLIDAFHSGRLAPDRVGYTKTR